MRIFIAFMMCFTAILLTGCDTKQGQSSPVQAKQPVQTVQSSAKKAVQTAQSSASKPTTSTAAPMVRKQPKKDAKPAIRAAVLKINQIMATSIYREDGSKEYSKYKVEYVGACNLYVNQSFVPMRHGTFTDTRTDVDLRIAHPPMSDEWHVNIKALHGKGKFPVVYDESNASEADGVDLWHAASKKTSADLVNALEAIIKADKCQAGTKTGKIKPKFDVKAQIVGDASVKFNVTTNIPGKVEVMMSYKLDKALKNYGKDYSSGKLLLENGVGEITLTGVGSGSKGTLYYRISPGRYVGELFFKPSWGLVDDVAKASKVDRDIEIVVPIKGRLKGQKEKFIPN